MRGRLRFGPRLLPSVILVATGLLGVKVTDLALRLADLRRTADPQFLPIASPAQAARVTAEPFRAAADTPVQPVPPNGAAHSAPSAEQRQAEMTAAERSVLEELRARRAALDAREQALLVRESVLAAAEQRLARRVEELAALQQRLEALDKASREREEAGWRGLVRIYESMRPRDAARIFNELEMVTLVEVVDRMKERTAAPILAGMDPEKAKALTAELARRRATGPRAQVGG
jgi:flagellar motility protein MotE (MotC chaperone)